MEQIRVVDLLHYGTQFSVLSKRIPIISPPNLD